MKLRRFILIVAVIFCGALQSQEMDVMTYNIKYANENDGENSWSVRKDWITRQIAFYEPDILGVQEAVISQLDYLTEKIGAYQFIGVGREGEDAGEFSAILYKKKKFKVLKMNTLWLSETPDKISKGWDADYNRVYTYGLFQNKKTAEKFWVFNTHFDHVGDQARLESSKLIIKKIKELNTENLPVLLMGDFNLEPETEGIQLISEHLKDSRMMAKLVFGPDGTFNAYKFDQPVTRRIDYIFSNEKVIVEKYAVLSDSKEMKYPSDHFPVSIVVKFSE
ncbi:endonuclease/exonuclease/phosphatase family protein [Gramella sp. MAR_2010_147]|uniref:endonuclease/exonuclease/phosphatase family protein n=1 Tax=Gramella sp. MAR_2010_147 TaxID=1250205 RepID=UPI00087AD6B4|nr:endonuclease/exonuclease/phosphatase family protein [Gramella sp. MAR_2010_147]SDS66461.1 Metal-dependent hydrolase, endonuclease/exonuclease/phosphatase family [Gramella sp. MAR_2010_147]